MPNINRKNNITTKNTKRSSAKLISLALSLMGILLFTACPTSPTGIEPPPPPPVYQTNISNAMIEANISNDGPSQIILN